MKNKNVAVVMCGSHMKITDTKVWKEFIDALNNPSQETVNNRKRFFEECDKLFITHDDDGVIHVESDKLNTEEILEALRINT